jgi:hypothetical protein
VVALFYKLANFRSTAILPAFFKRHGRLAKPHTMVLD